MSRLTREQILSIKDVQEEEVYIEQWGGSVLVRSLSGNERNRILNICMNKKGKMDSSKLYPLLIVAGCVDPAFSKEDIDALNNKNAGALEKLAKVIMKLSGLGPEDLEEDEEGETEAEKN